MRQELTLLVMISSTMPTATFAQGPVVFWGGNDTWLPADVGPTALPGMPTGADLTPVSARVPDRLKDVLRQRAVAAALPIDRVADARMDAFLRERDTRTSKKVTKRSGKLVASIG